MRDRSSGFCMPEYMYLYVNIYIYFFLYINISCRWVVSNVGERVMRDVGREKRCFLVSPPLSISRCAVRYCVYTGYSSHADSAKSRGIDQTDRNSNRLHHSWKTSSREAGEESVINRSLSDRMPLRSPFLEVRDRWWEKSSNFYFGGTPGCMRWHSALKIGRTWMPSAESCAAFTTGPGLRLIGQWKKKREHPGSSISFVWLFLPVSPLSECIFVESPIYILRIA